MSSSFKTKPELLKRAIEMRMRDDTYRSISGYLNKFAETEEIADEVLKEVDTLEKNKQLKGPKKPTDWPSYIIGTLMMIAGVALYFMLREYGWYSTLTLTLVGGGIVMFAKANG